ncbi:MAG TPA: helix-turn-helix transcriptional regulator [Candidatus Limnocylindrales bacterium]|nr:helix-turn-helix transcriptional regulator [Candidatus Limnocylindrales bacterium]
MLRTNLPRAVRILRRRRGWRQADLAVRSGLSREAISRVERGVLRGITVGSIERVVDALGGRLDVVMRWEGADLDRLMDALHAGLVEDVARSLAERGWSVRTEVSFNHFGDRGRVDVLAFHPGARLVVVAEVKSAVGNVQDTAGRLDVKVRLGRVIAAEVGWPDVAGVVPALVIGDTRSARRVVGAHPASFARFALRGRQAVAWLRRPVGVPSGLLWFTNVTNSREVTTKRDRRVRSVPIHG